MDFYRVHKIFHFFFVILAGIMPVILLDLTEAFFEKKLTFWAFLKYLKNKSKRKPHFRDDFFIKKE